jgi:hypothetical protein
MYDYLWLSKMVSFKSAYMEFAMVLRFEFLLTKTTKKIGHVDGMEINSGSVQWKE